MQYITLKQPGMLTRLSYMPILIGKIGTAWSELIQGQTVIGGFGAENTYYIETEGTKHCLRVLGPCGSKR